MRKSDVEQLLREFEEECVGDNLNGIVWTAALLS